MMTALLLVALSVSAITYHLEAGSSGDQLSERFNPAQLAVLEKLNRADLTHLGRQAMLVVPDTWAQDELAYSPMPRRYPLAAEYRRVVVVYQPAQVFGAYEYGTLVHWGPVSSGRRTDPTSPGLYYLNWRERLHTSTVDADWIMPWSFNFDNQVGYAFHEEELPGRPASHGCVRLLARDAQWLFEWADTWVLDSKTGRVLKLGTPVLILGEYDFGQAPPWHSLESLARPLTLPSM